MSLSEVFACRLSEYTRDDKGAASSLSQDVRTSAVLDQCCTMHGLTNEPEIARRLVAN